MARIPGSFDEFAIFSGYDHLRVQKPSLNVILGWTAITLLITGFWGGVTFATFFR